MIGIWKLLKQPTGIKSSISYSCPKCKFTIEKSDQAWDVAMQMGRCPECYTKLPTIVKLNPRSATKVIGQEPNSEPKPTSKHLLIFFILMIAAFGIAFIIDDDEVDKGLVKVIFKLLFYGVEALLSLSK